MLRYILLPVSVIGTLVVVIGCVIVSFGWFLVNVGTTAEAE